MLYISSRYDGIVYQVTPNGNMSRVRGRHGRRHRHRVRQRRQSVRRRPQRHDLQDQPRAARSSSSPRSSRRLPPITWRSAPTAICTSPDPPPRASIRCTASRTTARWKCSIAAWAVRRAWRSTTTATSTWPRRIAGRKGVVRIYPDRARRAVSLRPRHRRPGLHAVARHGRGHHQRALSRGRRHQGPAALLDERRNHRSRLRDADAASASTPTRSTSPRS